MSQFDTAVQYPAVTRCMGICVFKFAAYMLHSYMILYRCVDRDNGFVLGVAKLP